jgi:hypothetical protein
VRNRRLISSISIGTLFIIIAIPFVSTASTHFALDDWRYTKQVTLPNITGSDSLVELSPDAEVFSGTAASLADIRIIAADGTEIPYVLEVSHGESNRKRMPIKLIDLGYKSSSYDTFIALTSDSGIVHNEVEIRTSSKNFRRMATVETSKDRVTWTKVSRQPVYDFTVKETAFTTRNTRIQYPDSTAPFLRVRVNDNGNGSLKITDAVLSFVIEKPAREVTWPSDVTEINQSHDGDTQAIVDLKTEGIPSSRLELQVSDMNFYRIVTVEHSSDGKSWETLSKDAEVFAYDVPKFNDQDLIVPYRETTSRYLRIVIHNQNDPPLNIQGVEVQGLKRRLIFFATYPEPYKLYYGNPEAKVASYDIERLVNYLETETLPRAHLDHQLTNPYFTNNSPVSERYPWLLPLIIGLAAAALALLFLSIARKARRVLPPRDH